MSEETEVKKPVEEKKPTVVQEDALTQMSSPLLKKTEVNLIGRPFETWDQLLTLIRSKIGNEDPRNVCGFFVTKNQLVIYHSVPTFID